MSVYQTTIPVSLVHTEAQLSDLVFGTGATHWRWWERAMEYGGGVHIWVAEDCRSDMTRESSIGHLDLTWGELANAIRDAWTDGHLTAAEKAVILEDGVDALDAVGADTVLQVAVFGKVVFA